MEKVRIGRNDPCPCGSGKKYKKCCGRNIASIDLVLESELAQVQMDLMRWTLAKHRKEIDAYLAPYYEKLALNPQTKQMYQFFATTWYVNAVLREDGNTLLQTYCNEHKSKLSERVLAHLQRWQEAVPAVFDIKAWDGAYVFTEDLFTKEVKRVKAVGEGKAQREGGIAIGTILPAGESYIFLATFFHIPDSSGEVAMIKKEVAALYEKSGASDVQSWLAASFLQVLEQFMFESEEEPAAKAVSKQPEKEEKSVPSVKAESGLSAEHEEVAQAFRAYALGYDLPDYAEQIGMVLWKAYCEKTNPTLRKPEVAVAALVYLVDSIMESSSVTQAELARIYEVSATSISSRYKAMRKELTDEIEVASRKVPARV